MYQKNVTCRQLILLIEWRLNFSLAVRVPRHDAAEIYKILYSALLLLSQLKKQYVKESSHIALWDNSQPKACNSSIHQNSTRTVRRWPSLLQSTLKQRMGIRISVNLQVSRSLGIEEGEKDWKGFMRAEIPALRDTTS